MKQKTAVRTVFVAFQIIFAAIAYATKDIITLERLWPKKYSEEYIRWWFYEYETKGWHWSINLVVIASCIILAIAVCVLSETAHERKKLSAKQIGGCFFLVGLIRFAVHCLLCIAVEHYYFYFILLNPEALCVTLLLLSELMNKKEDISESICPGGRE